MDVTLWLSVAQQARESSVVREPAPPEGMMAPKGELEDVAASLRRWQAGGGASAGEAAGPSGEAADRSGGGQDADSDYLLAMRLQQQEVDDFRRLARAPATGGSAGAGRGGAGRAAAAGRGRRGNSKRALAAAPAAGPLDAFVKRVKR